ncbi:MAG: RND transporter [Bacteroidetes bacterium]|nr:MAG: RND transporter [Bacteroidota bacterium]
MKLTRPLLILLAIVVLAGGYFYFADSSDDSGQSNLLVSVKEGPLLVTIHASGELQAKRSEKIKGPDGLRSVGLYRVTIEDLIPEGTVVKEGDYVASLDKTELDEKIKESQTEIDKIETQLDQIRIDTAIEMRGLRDQLINLKFSLEDKKLSMELSKYEPQAIQKQAQLDMEKSEREYAQLENKLILTREKSIAKVGEIDASYRQQEHKLNRLLGFQKKMTIMAPKDGMVIYIRNWNGKRGPGSQISGWDATVAELPDLSEMMTMAYINEVDISKVMPGQNARITVDAFPGKEFQGLVVTKANIGEQIRNYDTKVFEVIVILQEQDSLLRPAMTTGISITVDSIGTCLQIPLEAIQSDSLSFVFKKTRTGFIKQEVVTGPSTDIDISIALGLSKNDMVSLNAPSHADDLEFVYLDQDEKRQMIQELENALTRRIKAQQVIARSVKQENLQSKDTGGSTFIIF